MAKKFLDYDGLQTLVTQTKSAISGTADSKIKAAVTDKLGAASGIATLDTAGKVPATQLPSYVDDVLEFGGMASVGGANINSTTGSDPANIILDISDLSNPMFVYKSGSTYYGSWDNSADYALSAGKIYVDISTNKSYRYSGSGLVEISASLAMGTTTGSGNAVTGMTVSDGVINLTKGNTFLESVAASTTGSGNVVTAITASGGTVSVTKGLTALTTVSATTSGNGNAVTAITASGGALTVTKGTTFLTGVNSTVSGSGNAITAITASGGTLTLTKGSTFALADGSNIDSITTSEITALFT